MISANIVGPAVLHQPGPQAFSRTGVSVMDDMKVGKALGRPAQHACFHFVHRVPAGCRPESPDCIPASTLINLRRAPDVKRRAMFDRLQSVNHVADNSPTDAKPGFSFEIRKTFLEIIGLERQVAIQLDQDSEVDDRKNRIPVGTGSLGSVIGPPKTSS